MYESYELARMRETEIRRALRRRAATPRLEPSLPRPLARTVRGRAEISIRRETSRDAVSLARLAELADRPLPPSPLLLVEADGALLAARSLVTGEAVSDPFSPTGDVLALLELRAGQLRPRRPLLRGLLRLAVRG